MTIGQRYAEALRTFGELDGPHADTMGDVAEGFTLILTLANGYGLSIARNGLSYGGESLAVLYAGRLLESAPEGVGMPSYNDLPLTGPEQAATVASKLSALDHLPV